MTSTNFAASRERTVRSIQQQLRGLSITRDQAERLHTAVHVAAAAAPPTTEPTKENQS